MGASRYTARMVSSVLTGVLCVGLVLCASLAADGRAEPPRGRRAAEGVSRANERAPDELRGRRAPEGTAVRARSAEELTREQRTLAIDWTSGGCAIEGHPQFVRRLLSLENQSALMSLEVWGDAEEYVPFDQVTYFIRVPRAAYVTLFWIGPRDDVFVSFENLRVPADRDVSVNPDAIVVPPLGRERWVAFATLEPFDFPCRGDEREHLAWVDRVVAVPHGVGRWEVMSRPTRTERPKEPLRR